MIWIRHNKMRWVTSCCSNILHCAAAAILYCTILYSIHYIVNSIHFMICSYVYMLDQLHEIICRLILHYMW